MELTKMIDLADLKQGDTFGYNGYKYKATEDAKEIPHRPGVYYAGCKIENPQEVTGANSEILINYDRVQGNADLCICLVK